MKKTLLTSLLALTISLTACSSGSNEATTDTKSKTNFGLALDTRLEDSSDGKAETTVNMAAVTLNEKGVVIDCTIDSLNAVINFTSEGVISTPLDTKFMTKTELGDSYGMKKASSIDKEWYEQADFFAEYCKGKTSDEIRSIEAGADIASGCTMDIEPLKKVVTMAMENVGESEAAESDKIGLGVIASMENSSNANVENDGVTSLNVTVSALAADENGKITASLLDSVQADVKFGMDGKITSITNMPVASKNDQGSSYGMVSASSIGREWNMQADSFAKYFVGKTAEDITSFPSDDGYASDADIASSVTINITDFRSAMDKAIKNAK